MPDRMSLPNATGLPCDERLSKTEKGRAIALRCDDLLGCLVFDFKIRLVPETHHFRVLLMGNPNHIFFLRGRAAKNNWRDIPLDLILEPRICFQFQRLSGKRIRP